MAMLDGSCVTKVKFGNHWVSCLGYLFHKNPQKWVQFSSICIPC